MIKKKIYKKNNGIHFSNTALSEWAICWVFLLFLIMIATLVMCGSSTEEANANFAKVGAFISHYWWFGLIFLALNELTILIFKKIQPFYVNDLGEAFGVKVVAVIPTLVFSFIISVLGFALYHAWQARDAVWKGLVELVSTVVPPILVIVGIGAFLYGLVWLNYLWLRKK